MPNQPSVESLKLNVCPAAEKPSTCCWPGSQTHPLNTIDVASPWAACSWLIAQAKRRSGKTRIMSLRSRVSQSRASRISCSLVCTTVQYRGKENRTRNGAHDRNKQTDGRRTSTHRTIERHAKDCAIGIVAQPLQLQKVFSMQNNTYTQITHILTHLLSWGVQSSLYLTGLFQDDRAARAIAIYRERTTHREPQNTYSTSSHKFGFLRVYYFCKQIAIGRLDSFVLDWNWMQMDWTRDDGQFTSIFTRCVVGLRVVCDEDRPKRERAKRAHIET